MFIRKLDPATFGSWYGIACKQIFPCEEVGSTPFSALWNVVPPSGATKLHRHHEGETFIITRGAGEITIGEETSAIEAGDVVFMPPFTDHTVANGSETEELWFLNVYWEDIELIFQGEQKAPEPAALEAEAGEQPAPAEPDGATAPGRRRTIVFPSPPNPNGDLHLGHLAGPYLVADVIARYGRMLGEDAHFAVGTDDNQVWTATMAAARGENPQETADRFASRIAKTLALAGSEVSHFYRPNESPLHHQLTEEFVRRLHENGHLVARDAPALWCETCDLYLFEARVSGGCPHCGKGCCGNYCEECGLINDCVDLVEPVCKGCGEKPSQRPVRRLFFPIAPHREVLLRYYSQAAIPTKVRALASRMLENEDLEIVASHPSDWGLPVPLPGFEGQSVSAWLEMVPGYLAAADAVAAKAGLDEGWRAFWASEKGQVVLAFGFDNGWNHAVFYPALLHAYDPSIRAPRAYVVNQMYQLDHKKFSTSRGHAVWVRDLVEEAGADAARFYCALTRPEVEQTNFSRGAFDRFRADELEGRWAAWLRGLGERVASAYGGAVPEAGAWTDNHRAFLARLKRLLDDAAEAYDVTAGFSLQRVARIACELVREARELGVEEDAWGGLAKPSDERRTGMALEIAAARTLALVVQPLMPGFAATLWRALGYEADVAEEAWDSFPRFVSPNQAAAGLAKARYFPAGAAASRRSPNGFPAAAAAAVS